MLREAMSPIAVETVGFSSLFFAGEAPEIVGYWVFCAASRCATSVVRSGNVQLLNCCYKLRVLADAL